MDHWVTIVLFGAVIFGFAWLIPNRQTEDRAHGGSDPAYEQLLEELETENRELLDAVSKFKVEQDETLQRMVKQIGDLQQQMQAMAAEQSSAERLPAVAEQAPTAAAAEAIAEPSAATETVVPSAPAQQQSSAMTESMILPTSIRERYAGLLTLHRKGKSIEQIAKSSGMNKGEVQLILQLARREEEQLA